MWRRHIVNGMILVIVSLCRGRQVLRRDSQNPSSKNDDHEDFLGRRHLNSPYEVRWKGNDGYICKDVEESYGVPESNLERKLVPLWVH